ncbi:hypothetical protein [Curtobacterium citreum]|uniref:hypothetical protein n=1 Tax=Curtobacterium citreum TaxID=2036 RepID=UPI002543F6AF|nr:hypothetical protein [Curtobacterium citreum]WIJ46180.1 hypothetical protein QPK07_04225 [Curtobacterium citreum]
MDEPTVSELIPHQRDCVSVEAGASRHDSGVVHSGWHRERTLRTAIAAFLSGQRELAACADFVADETGFLDEKLAVRVTDLLTTTPEAVAEEERVAVRHETESKESLRQQQEALRRATDSARAESIPPLEELYALERDGRYAQILDASWSKPNG